MPPERLEGLNAGEALSVGPGITVRAVPAAHEALKVNEKGEHHFLGFVISFGDITLYHSGDCVPYEGLAAVLRDIGVDVALLPINGRDDARRSKGIAGNFTFQEAVDLCRACGIPVMLAHHFGMFAFNTISEDNVARRIRELEGDIRCVLPRTDVAYVISNRSCDGDHEQ